jgi:hypothetical protein
MHVKVFVLIFALWIVSTKFFAFFLNCEAQQTNITHITATLSEPRDLLAATSSGELVFFGGGYDGTKGSVNRVDIYNATSGNWTTTTLSVPRSELAAVSSVNLVFFAGGFDETNFYSQVDVYNVSNGNWSTATLSQNRSDLAATSVGNFVLFGGGRNFSATYSNVVDIYNMTNNTWTTATLSQARCCLAATSVANRYALFAGGWNGTGPSNVVDVFDSSSGMWNTTTLSEPRANLTAVSLGNLSFFAGGLNIANQSSNTVDIFNSTSQMWSTAALSQNRSNLAAASNDSVVAFGGGFDGSAVSSVVDMYLLSTDTWLTVNLSQPRDYLAATSTTNKILFGGGYNSTSTSSRSANITSYSNVVDIFEIQLISPPSSSSSPPVATPTAVPIKAPSIMTPNPSSPVPASSPSSSQISTNSPTSPISISAPSSTASSSQTKGSISGALIGGVIAAVIAIVAAVVLLVVLLRRKRIRKSRPRKFELIDERRPSHVAIEPIPFNELQLQGTIGYGSYGKVERAKWKNADVAVRFCTEKGTLEDFQAVAKTLIDLPPHPNVVQVYGISLDGQQSVLVLEYCSGGTLRENMGQVKLLGVVKGIVEGMIHLHKHNIVHGNLTAKNILLSRNGDPKISDYGLLNLAVRTGAGPLRWMAPESLKNQEFTLKSDVWMFGVVVWEIVTQQEPYQDIDDIHFSSGQQFAATSLQIPDQCPTFLKEIMEKCWQTDPSERPTFEDIRLKLKSAE